MKTTVTSSLGASHQHVRQRLKTQSDTLSFHLYRVQNQAAAKKTEQCCEGCNTGVKAGNEENDDGTRRTVGPCQERHTGTPGVGNAPSVAG